MFEIDSLSNLTRMSQTYYICCIYRYHLTFLILPFTSLPLLLIYITSLPRIVTELITFTTRPTYRRETVRRFKTDTSSRAVRMICDSSANSSAFESYYYWKFENDSILYFNNTPSCHFSFECNAPFKADSDIACLE